jgi:hypothetical protein
MISTMQASSMPLHLKMEIERRPHAARRLGLMVPPAQPPMQPPQGERKTTPRATTKKNNDDAAKTFFASLLRFSESAAPFFP